MPCYSDGLAVCYIKILLNCLFELLDDRIFTLPKSVKFCKCKIIKSLHERNYKSYNQRKNFQMRGEMYKQSDEQF